MLPTVPAVPSIALASDLQAWLQRAAAYPSEYDDQLSSHLPMALHALHSLGADERQMQQFFERYVGRFEARRAPPAGHALADWTAALGQAGRFVELRASFKQQLAERSAEAVLQAALPVLLQGVTAVAFHGAIRVAHAVQGADLHNAAQRAELASALAYWASRWQRLPAAAPQAVADERLSLSAWSQKLQVGSLGWRSKAPLIFLRMLEASAFPLYQDLASRFPLRAKLSDCIADLANLSLGYYLASGNFTVLHMITGLRALRVLLPYVPQELQQDPATQYLLAEAFVAAYLAGRVQQRPALLAAVEGEPLAWSALIAAACEAHDDHAIKLVHACVEEMRVYGDARYLQAAALALA